MIREGSLLCFRTSFAHIEDNVHLQVWGVIFVYLCYLHLTLDFIDNLLCGFRSTLLVVSFILVWLSMFYILITIWIGYDMLVVSSTFTDE